MRIELQPYIAGLGIIFYSPFAVAHIARNSDYLRSNFWNPKDVAQHIMNCEIACFCTGNPGDWYHLIVFDGQLDQTAVRAAKHAIRVGIRIQDRTLCFRDLYDLMEWDPHCPTDQQFDFDDGFYRVTVYTTPEGLDSSDRIVYLHFEKTLVRPELRWDGVPQLC